MLYIYQLDIVYNLIVTIYINVYTIYVIYIPAGPCLQFNCDNIYVYILYMLYIYQLDIVYSLIVTIYINVYILYMLYIYQLDNVFAI